MNNARLEQLLLDLMTAAFNRSLTALEAAGAIDLSKMRSAYRGVGSRYYDLVTEELLKTLRWQQPEIEKFLAGKGGDDR